MQTFSTKYVHREVFLLLAEGNGAKAAQRHTPNPLASVSLLGFFCWAHCFPGPSDRGGQSYPVMCFGVHTLTPPSLPPPRTALSRYGINVCTLHRHWMEWVVWGYSSYKATWGSALHLNHKGRMAPRVSELTTPKGSLHIAGEELSGGGFTHSPKVLKMCASLGPSIYLGIYAK